MVIIMTSCTDPRYSHMLFLLGRKVRNRLNEIKIHYRKYAKIHHPDKGGDAEQFKQLQEAYEILMDPIKRHQYDIDLSG